MILLMVCITLLLAAPDALVSASYAAAREMAAEPADSAQVHESSGTEGPSESGEKHESEHLVHRVAFFTGNTVVPDGETRSGVLVVPTFGVDYQYWFSHRWAAMASFELELLNYTVETKEGTYIDRDTPVVLAVLGVFEAIDRLGLVFGAGVELESHESLRLVRFGGEYAFPVQNDWDISVTMYGDVKEEFWALTAGLMIGKRF